jgi:hypothetical protein
MGSTKYKKCDIDVSVYVCLCSVCVCVCVCASRSMLITIVVYLRCVNPRLVLMSVGAAPFGDKSCRIGV